MLQTAPAPSSMPSLDFEKLEVLFHSSIKTIDQTAWERCFPDELEGYDYHVGLENAAIKGFALGWYAASINGLLVCAVPVPARNKFVGLDNFYGWIYDWFGVCCGFFNISRRKTFRIWLIWKFNY